MAKLFEQIDNKILAMKIDQAMEMLKTRSPAELQSRVGRMDRNELLKKLSELDREKVKEMKIDTEKIRRNLTAEDREKIRAVAGKDADLVLATDPDADRLGVYAKDAATGEYKVFSGNMSGMLAKLNELLGG